MLDCPVNRELIRIVHNIDDPIIARCCLQLGRVVSLLVIPLILAEIQNVFNLRMGRKIVLCVVLNIYS